MNSYSYFTRMVLLLVALVALASAAFAATATLVSDSPAALTATTPPAESPVPQWAKEPVTLGEVVFTFVAGLVTIAINTVRGYVMLPPL
ncbi:hypothetical protein EV175_002750 [Coemansia sp. RSA 1933]|nr:hypothetical protein EV175_002750 [Coemansia sp. RSA 1933]